MAIVFVMAILPLQAQLLYYKTAPLIQEIKTLQVIVDEDFMNLPVIDLEGNSSLEISFDYLAEEQPWLCYRILHCDAEWKPDNLSEMDYADGFFPVRIEDVKPSFNTFTSYFHHKIFFPNEDVQLKVSGNYAVLIHPEGEEDNIVAVATFSVSEQMLFAKGEVSANTDIDFHATHQQLSFEVSWSQTRLPYLDPINELKIFARQNRNEATKREVKMPLRIETGRAIYEHNRDLIFEARNVFRRFEFVNEKSASMGVEYIRYQAPHYVANLWTDKPRNNVNFRYDKTQFGRYLIRATRVSDVDTEADYFKAVFTLDAPPSYNVKGIYLTGDFSYGEESEEFRMNYDSEQNIFWKEIILKQGAYNYMYSVGDNPSPIEGNFYETENEYDIFIYYHPNGARYDRLMGVGTIR